ncbi:hypothetical protein AB0B85_30845 [Micromonospora sp. NPDC049044]|uniref:hypothetical protein n=1 Tax=unclassified Micromonospora TaxID=2617518 RepID=UPI0033FBBE4B
MTDAAHRLLWTIVALLLVAGGVTALAVGSGALPFVDPDAVLLGGGPVDAWRVATPWSTLSAAVAGLLTAVAGQRLLYRALRRPDRVLRGTLSRTGSLPGRTRLATEVLVRALERDLLRAPGVHRARVVLTGTPPRPDVWVRVDLTSDARTAGVREHVHDAVRRFATTAGCQPAHLDVTARIEPAHS